MIEHRIGLLLTDRQLFNSISFCTIPDGHEFQIQLRECSTYIFQASQTNLTYLIAAAAKINGVLRNCNSYFKLNASTNTGFYPTSHMDECMESFVDLLISTLHASSRSWQVGIPEFDHNGTASSFHYHFYRPRHMNFRI